eukprot:g699.t1
MKNWLERFTQNERQDRMIEAKEYAAPSLRMMMWILSLLLLVKTSSASFLHPTNVRRECDHCHEVQKKWVQPIWESWSSRIVDTTQVIDDTFFFKTARALESLVGEFPCCADASFVAGIQWSQVDRHEKATAHYAEGVWRTRGMRSNLSPRARYFLRANGQAVFQGQDIKVASKAKLLHDAEQIRWLIARGKLSRSYAAAVEDLEDVAAVIDEKFIGYLRADLYSRVAPFLNRLLYHRPPQLMPVGESVFRHLNVNKLRSEYTKNKIAVVDSVLSPKALHILRMWLLDSTFWFDIKPEGYVGAYLENGMDSPFLHQLVAELKSTFPDILGPHRLNTIWAYKYEANGDGIKVHADTAAVNLNLWITPDAANLDANSGGLAIFRKEAPAEWNFADFNTKAGLPKMNEFLKDSDVVKIPYRQNRMVMFNSNMFHYSDAYKFRPGYSNRRINLTFLFGSRQGNVYKENRGTTKALFEQADGMTSRERECLRDAYDQENVRVFEWGMGSSTQLAAACGVVRLVAVDSAEAWVDKIRKNVPEMYELVHVNIGPTGEWGYPLDSSKRDMWSAYSLAVDDLAQEGLFDVFLVDGRFRVACALRAMLHNPNARIFVHDFERKAYRPLLRYSDVKQRVGVLAELTRKAGVEDGVLLEAWEEHRYNPV